LVTKHCAYVCTDDGIDCFWAGGADVEYRIKGHRHANLPTPNRHLAAAMMPTALAVLNPFAAVFCFRFGFVSLPRRNQALAQNTISFEVVELDDGTRQSRCFDSERQLRYRLPVYSALNQSVSVKSYHSGPGRTREVWLVSGCPD